MYTFTPFCGSWTADYQSKICGETVKLCNLAFTLIKFPSLIFKIFENVQFHNM